jgi:type IV pilus assembly protein PilE
MGCIITRASPERKNWSAEVRKAGRRGRLGLTLIEALIGLVVVGILVAIGIPTYHTRVLRARRAEAIEALERIRMAEEHFFLEHNGYSAELAAAPPRGLGLSLGKQPRYALGIEVSEARGAIGFNAHARLREPALPADATCVSFAVNQNGVRSATDAGGADRTDECWRE